MKIWLPVGKNLKSDTSTQKLYTFFSYKFSYFVLLVKQICLPMNFDNLFILVSDKGNSALYCMTFNSYVFLYYLYRHKYRAMFWCNLLICLCLKYYLNFLFVFVGSSTQTRCCNSILPAEFSTKRNIFYLKFSFTS